MTRTPLIPEVDATPFSEVGHETVLLQESVDSLRLEPGMTAVDATVGGAGHFRLIASALGKEGTLIGIDADEDALGRAATTGHTGPKLELVHDNFSNLGAILERLSVPAPSAFLFDLGWSGYQLASGRGFSFRADEPLYMTYGMPDGHTTAEDIVNETPEPALADLIYQYGEERFSRGIARSIVAARKEARITTTGALVTAIENGVPGFYRRGRLHPATKTFQALRIAVNDEFGAIEEGFKAALAHAAPGARIAMITFHSLEDRLVKNLFRDAASAGKGTVITKKPIAPSREELSHNPRARSAKLRVFECSADYS